MQMTMVEVLDNAGCVITHLQAGAAVEAVRNIQVNGRMMVSCDAGVLEINADLNIHDQTICIQIKNGNNYIGYMWPESFVKIYM